MTLRIAEIFGPTIQGEGARTMVIASIDVVDVVIVFTDDTPRGLIEALRPDVLVKGADYTEDRSFSPSHHGRRILT